MSDEFPATKTAHWPSGPVFCCDRHCAAIDRIASAMGMHLAITHAVPEGAECGSCKNEASKNSRAIPRDEPLAKEGL